MNNERIKVKSNNNALSFLRPVLQTSCEVLDEYYAQAKLIPNLCLPSASKEIALAPVLFHAAHKAFEGKNRKYWPSSEISVVRKTGKAAGRLDLGLFSDKRIVLIESKGRRPKLFGSPLAVLNKSLSSAKNQLKDIDTSIILDARDSRKITLVSLVVLNLVVPESKINKDLESEFESKVKAVLNDGPDRLVASIFYGLHEINIPPGYSSVGQIFVAEEI